MFQPAKTMISSRVVCNSLRRVKPVSHIRGLRTLYTIPSNFTNQPDHSKNDLFLKNEFNHNLCSTLKRFKSKQKRSKIQEDFSDDEDGDSDNDDDDGEDVDESLKHSKIVVTTVRSLRLDLVLKAGLGMSRNKVDAAFYDSKVRKNGQKVFKKSDMLDVNDEVDLIKNISPENPNFLVVKRIKILSIKPVLDTFKIKIARDKHLLIANYDNEPWQSNEEQ